MVYNVSKGDNMTKRTDSEIEQEAIRLYSEKTSNGWMGVYEISKRLGVSKTTVQNILARNNVGTRDSKMALDGKQCKPIKNVPTGTAPLCKCGCGKPVAWNRRKNRWEIYFEDHRRPPHLYKDRDWLRSQYESGRTIPDIAKQFSTIPSAVYKFFRRFGLKARPHGETLKMTGSSKGSKNPAWKGGVTPERQKVYKTEEWQKLVKRVYKRDGHTCQLCGIGNVSRVSFHAHHIRSWAKYPELRLDPSNLVTLCGVCHRWVHSRKNVSRKFLAS
jgi:hypothetical protein